MELKGVSFSYGPKEIFKDFSLEIPESKVLSILGPSGCGKTTLLRLLSGSLSPESGKIEDYTNNISYIFQEPRLLPWMTLIDNVEFPLKEDDKSRAKHYIEEMGLGKDLNSYPGQLSGGMAQRVSIARAFAFNSDLILMDEPFKGLDPRLKNNIFRIFNKLITKEKRTSVFVTHDINESITLGDKIVVLGGSPVKIVGIIENPITPEQRNPGSDEIISLEKDIYSLISSL